MGITIGADGPVALDTAVFIYYVEEHPSFLPLIEHLFEAADAGTGQIVTSAVTLLELLVIPYRNEDFKLAARYEELMSRSRGIRMIDLDRSQLRAAASLRAKPRISAKATDMPVAADKKFCTVNANICVRWLMVASPA